MIGLGLFSAANAWASAAGPEHHVPTIGEVVLPAINFVIYAAVLYYFALPLVRSMLRSRHDEVVTALRQASAKKEQAEALVREYRSKLAAVDGEARAIESSLRADAVLEQEKILNEAKLLAGKLQEDARFLAAREAEVARENIRAELAAQAEGIARELLQKNISPEDHGRLAQEFIREVGHAR
jgi:F-type H+-transporting ATPase subunit b